MGFGIAIGFIAGAVGVWYIMRKRCNVVTGRQTSGGIDIMDPFGSFDGNPDGNYPASSMRTAIRMY